MQKSFYETLPELPQVPAEEAEIAWLIYDLQKNEDSFHLIHDCTVYTKFDPAITRITKPEPGNVDEFMELLQNKLNEHLDDNPPDAPTLTDIILK